MKTALKKSFVLIGIALFFVLMAWAEQKIWAWDKNVLEEEYCISGYFEKNGENATTVYGYCVCFQGFCCTRALTCRKGADRGFAGRCDAAAGNVELEETI